MSDVNTGKHIARMKEEVDKRQRELIEMYGKDPCMYPEDAQYEAFKICMQIEGVNGMILEAKKRKLMESLGMKSDSSNIVAALAKALGACDGDCENCDGDDHHDGDDDGYSCNTRAPKKGAPN